MYVNLKKELAGRNITNRAVANCLGIHENSVNYKLTRGSFTIEEAFAIKSNFFSDIDLTYLFRRAKDNEEKTA